MEQGWREEQYVPILGVSQLNKKSNPEDGGWMQLHPSLVNTITVKA